MKCWIIFNCSAQEDCDLGFTNRLISRFTVLSVLIDKPLAGSECAILTSYIQEEMPRHLGQQSHANLQRSSCRIL